MLAEAQNRHGAILCLEKRSLATGGLTPSSRASFVAEAVPERMHPLLKPREERLGRTSQQKSLLQLPASILDDS